MENNWVEIKNNTGSVWVNLNNVNRVYVMNPVGSAWYYIYTDDNQLPLKFVSESGARAAIRLAMEEAERKRRNSQ